MNSVTLWYFEHVDNNLGLYSREWFAFEQQANEARAALCERYGHAPDDDRDPDNVIGEYGDVTSVRSEDVQLSASGILEFARNYAGCADSN